MMFEKSSENLNSLSGTGQSCSKLDVGVKILSPGCAASGVDLVQSFVRFAFELGENLFF